MDTEFRPNISERFRSLTLENNTIISVNGSILIGGSTSWGGLDFSNNTLVSHSSASALSLSFSSHYYDYDYTPTFNNNNFLFHSHDYSLENNSTQDIDLTGNYWGILSDAEIETLIIDYFDDFEKGKINYQPKANAIIEEAPIAPPQEVVVTVAGNSISLNWVPNQEGDLAGYKIYWGSTEANRAYSEMVDVGNLTSYTLNSMASGTYYLSLTAYDNQYDLSAEDSATLTNENQTMGHESWYSLQVKATIQ